MVAYASNVSTGVQTGGCWEFLAYKSSKNSEDAGLIRDLIARKLGREQQMKILK